MIWYSMVGYCADMVQLALFTTSCSNQQIVPARPVYVAPYASIDTTRSGTYLKAPGISMIGSLPVHGTWIKINEMLLTLVPWTVK